MVSELFRIKVLQFKARGGKLYRLAIDHGMTPSTFSASLWGARRVDGDDRIVEIGAHLGLTPEECFEGNNVVAS